MKVNPREGEAAAGAWGVYLHVPFCRKLCPYCDFNVRIGHDALIPRYVAALAAEVRLRAEAIGPAVAASVYLGGGTPSLLSPAQVAALLRAVDDVLPIRGGAEVTLETNPGTVDLATLAAFRAAGVNRLSLGVQSLGWDGLRALGRDHGPEEAIRAVPDARAAGFDDVGVDLIYGWPGQTLEAWRADLEGVLSLGPDHLSLYNLTVEARTVFGARARKGALVLPGEPLQAAMYREACRAARRGGLLRYEVSNFARPGREARHNRLYWTGAPYVGAGAGAHGFDPAAGGRGGGRRWWNEPSPRRWCALVERGTLPEAGAEDLDLAQAAVEEVLTRLRTAEGLDPGRFEARFGPGPALRLRRSAARLRERGLVASPRRAGAAVRLTEKGVILGDYVVSEIAAALDGPP